MVGRDLMQDSHSCSEWSALLRSSLDSPLGDEANILVEFLSTHNLELCESTPVATQWLKEKKTSPSYMRAGSPRSISKAFFRKS